MFNNPTPRAAEEEHQNNLVCGGGGSSPGADKPIASISAPETRKTRIVIGDLIALSVASIPADATPWHCQSAVLSVLETGAVYRITGADQWFEIEGGIAVAVAVRASVRGSDGAAHLSAGIWLIGLMDGG